MYYFDLLGIVVVCLFVSQLVSAQVYYSSLVGTVRDPSGAVVPNATVVVIEVSTNIKILPINKYGLAPADHGRSQR